MERAILYRDIQDDLVTFGTLKLPWTWDGESMVQCRTMELPWRNNETNISCIPKGIYPLVPVYSNTFGHILWIQNVPGRSLIRIHAGNRPSHTHGCVLTGLATGTVKGDPFIFNSRDALRLIVNNIQALYDGGEECEIEVADV